MSRSKGARYERELVNELQNEDWFAMRVDASGSGTDSELPDILAAKEGNIVVIELKFTSGSRISVKKEKLRGLKWLASHLDASPLIAARFSGDTTYHMFPPGMMKENEKSITAGKSDREKAMTLI